LGREALTERASENLSLDLKSVHFGAMFLSTDNANRAGNRFLLLKTVKNGDFLRKFNYFSIFRDQQGVDVSSHAMDW
jgi:hypothetical protein